MNRTHLRWPTALIFALLALAGLSCGVGETAFEDFVNIDNEGLPAAPTWEEHVRPRLNYYCTGCHDPDSSAGALANLDLTNADDACSDLVPLAIKEQSMPPGDMLKMSPRDYAIVVRWQSRPRTDGGCRQATP